MIGDVKMQTVKRRTGRSLTGDRPLFLALSIRSLFNSSKTNTFLFIYLIKLKYLGPNQDYLLNSCISYHP